MKQCDTFAGRLLHRCQVPKPQHCNVRTAERNPSGLKPQLESDAAIYTIGDVYAGELLRVEFHVLFYIDHLLVFRFKPLNYACLLGQVSHSLTCLLSY
jgi:hypothetical protein